MSIDEVNDKENLIYSKFEKCDAEGNVEDVIEEQLKEETRMNALIAENLAKVKL